MKKFYSLMLVAVAAMAFTACSQDDTQDVVKPEGATKTITVSAETDTRVTLNADHTKMQWVEGDVFSLFTDADANQQLTYTEGATNFELEVAEAAAEVYAYYPYYSMNTDKTSVSLDVTSSQDQAVAGVLQGANDSGSGQYPMVAVATPIENNSVSLTFRPVACAFAFNIYGEVAEGEQIVSVSFTPADGEAVAGAESVDLTTLAADYEYTAANGSATTATVTLGTPFTPDTTKPADTQAYDKQVYLTVAAKAYAGGTFVVTTTETTYTFTTASTLDCTGKDFIPMNLNLAKGEKPQAATFVRLTSLAQINTVDTYIMTGNNSGLYSATNTFAVWAGTVNSSNKTRLNTISVTEADGKIVIEDLSTVGTFKLEDAGEGQYYVKTASGYLYNASSNTLSVDATNKSAWTIHDISEGNTGKEGFYLTTSTARLFCNASPTGSTSLRAYASNIYNGIYFFAKDAITEQPALAVDVNTVEFAAESAVAATVNVTLYGGLTDFNVAEDAEWLTVTKSGNELTLTAADNSLYTERTATVTLSASGADDVTIAVTQAAYEDPSAKTMEFDMTKLNPAIASASKVLYEGADAYWYDNTTFSAETKIALVFDKGTNSEAPSKTSSYSNTNFYEGTSLTIEGKTMSKIAFEFTSDSYNGGFSASVGAYDAETYIWTGSANKVTFTTSTSARLTKITITYDETSTAVFTPAVVAVDPDSVKFTVDGEETTKTLTATVRSTLGGITVSGLSGNLSASVLGMTVTVTANTSAADEQTLVIGTEEDGGASISVPVEIVELATGAAAPGTVLWSEDWTDGKNATAISSYANGGTTVYNEGEVTYTTEGTVQTYTGQYSSGGAGGAELYIKAGGKYTVTGIPTGSVTSATLTFMSNRDMSVSSESVTLTKDSYTSKKGTYMITIPSGLSTFDLSFEFTSKNARVDDIKIVVN